MKLNYIKEFKDLIMLYFRAFCIPNQEFWAGECIACDLFHIEFSC